MREAINYLIREKGNNNIFLNVINNLETNHIFIEYDYSTTFIAIFKNEVIRKYPSIVIIEDTTNIPISIAYWDGNIDSQTSEDELRRLVNECLCDTLKKTKYRIEHYESECSRRFVYSVIERRYIHEGKIGQFEDVVEYAYWKGYKKGTKYSSDDLIDVHLWLEEYEFLKQGCGKNECTRYDNSNFKFMDDDVEENLNDSHQENIDNANKEEDRDVNEDENYLDEELPFL